jgi:type I restriction enzyme S subunit
LEELVIPFTGSWGSDKRSADTQEFLVLGVGNVTNEGELDLKGATKRYLTREEMGGVAEEDDLIVVKSSGSAANIRSGKTAICPAELSGKIACSNFMMRLEVKRDLADPYLLWLILNSRAAKKFIRDIVGASTYPNIKWENYRRFELELPPLEEQRRIGARLHEQLSILGEARAALEAQLGNAESLPAAHLRAVFESDDAKWWPCQKIGDLARLQSGYAFKSEWFAAAGIRLLRNVNIAHGRTVWDETAYLPIDRRPEFADFELNEGDIILSLDRPVVAGGLKLTRMTHRDVPAVLLQRVGRFIINGELDSDYLFCFLQTRGFIDAITAHDQSIGVPHVSPKQVEAIEIPLPRLTDQHAIAGRLGEKFSAANALCIAISAKLAELEKLPAALLRTAFSPAGEGRLKT